MIDAEAIDRVAILDLFARYQRAVNIQGSHGHTADLFTEDGEFHSLAGPVEGRARLSEFFAGTHADGRFSAFRGGVHIFGNPEITVQGDRAEAHSEMTLIRPGEPGEILLMLTYDDDLRKVEGKWLFRSRRLQRISAQGG